MFLLLIGLSLPGCKKDESGNTTATANSPAATSAPSQELDIAAAADLQFALKDLAAEYTKTHPEADVKITYGSSGNFFTQITNKAPFDLFLSADMSYPNQLVEKGLAQKGSEFQYAQGRIVLWAPNGSKFDPATRKMKALLDPSLKKLAIANPQHAPYGRAAKSALEKYKLWDTLQPKIVMGQNIAETAQFVQSGNADAGIIALSLALAPPMKNASTYFQIPLEDYPKMDQGGVVLSYAK
ncbi:MAG TPA: molybdate ABC transporter substrate-binding protein, partial [Tepidisphaeraceae bacterium]|nr:molybdate ABC transporter substrate-binding protein [Tepidisphaeraceae bacterium]